MAPRLSFGPAWLRLNMDIHTWLESSSDHEVRLQTRGSSFRLRFPKLSAAEWDEKSLCFIRRFLIVI
jgi:hypothetical protein